MNKLGKHFKGFFPIWLSIIILCAAAYFAWCGHWCIAKIVGGGSLVLIIGLLIWKPMNAVYGLMGTTGDIRLFFLNFIFISTIFAGIYYFGFFHNAGISYDVNQPHIEFNAFCGNSNNSFTISTENHIPIYTENSDDPTSFILERENTNYQRVELVSVISNTIMTSLMQEPTDLFSAAAIYNRAQDSSNRSPEAVVPHGVTLSEKNVEMAQAFHFVLILQILISWIFFGVFISLLYSKFRYES